MPDYHVTWKTDVFDAPDPHTAAQQAWDSMRRPDSIANLFTVEQFTALEKGPRHDIDLRESCEIMELAEDHS